MSIKSNLNFSCARWRLAQRILRRQRHRLYSQTKLGRSRIRPVRGHCKAIDSQVSYPEPRKWQLHLDIQQTNEVKTSRSLSLPLLIHFYSPWQLWTTKLNLWKLKLFWDWRFRESEFVENARQSLVLVTRLIVDQRGAYIKRCTTPMGYKQIMHDLIKPKDEQSSNNPHKLLRFEKYHIQRAIPLQVQRLEHYDHRFAFIDMIFLACRRTDDFTSSRDLMEMKQLVNHYAIDRNICVENPIVFAEIFVRFRRDYSMASNTHAGRWMISTFKVIHLDVVNQYPEFYVKSVESVAQHAPE